jgi:protein kinase A
VKLHQLQKHSILGEGTFGIVWLVSDPTNQKEKKYYALKKQSKAFLIGENQVEAVIQEKIMLENMRHPFLIQLEKTYQDECFIYMLLEFVQGGELFSLMHEDESSTLPEHQAKFYALCLSDVLDYLRNRKYVYRDLKGENVMLDAKGYVKLIDFGFCKYLLAEKTYTLCGTPGYLSPEMVTVQGHSFSTDNWSLGVLIYEMIAGSSPFYYDGIDQSELFDAIALDDYPPLPDTVSTAAKDLVAGLLQKDPVTRYGSPNQCKIQDHIWFEELDLEAMRHREMEAPWVPYLDGPLDTSNFNDWSELEQAEKDGTIGSDGDVSKKGLAVSKRDQKLFEGVF